MKLQFLGATQTVTGSKYLIKYDNKKILIDCGLFQGLKELRLRNWQPLPIDASTLDAVILTHAHIDHSGYLPLLVKNGFRGPIYCSKATADLCKILLPDSAYLQEEEARHANRHHSSKHHPALPLYTSEDAALALTQLETVDFAKDCLLDAESSFKLYPAGHILGASFIIFKHQEISILFSGDVGRLNDPIMYPPDPIIDATYLVIESTYGDRQHPLANDLEELANIINQTAKMGGSILIPAFAVGRAQSILYFLYQLKKKKLIPNLPIYLDSPMAINATELFYHYANLHRLDKETAREVCNIANYVTTQEDSKAINLNSFPKIIISASGMATGGRVLHHLIQLAPEHKNSIVFTGYQAIGTRGDALVHGKKAIKIFGQSIEVNAPVFSLDNLSAHADYKEMIQWLSGIKQKPKKVFITHGEEKTALSFKEKLEKRFGWNCAVPHYLQVEGLD